MTTSQELEDKIRKARLLADLQHHAGWKIIAEKLDLEIRNQITLLQEIGLPADRTEGARFRIQAMRWLLDATNLNNADQVDKWERQLAFQQKQEKMRTERGLPADLKELQR